MHIMPSAHVRLHFLPLQKQSFPASRGSDSAHSSWPLAGVCWSTSERQASAHLPDSGFSGITLMYWPCGSICTTKSDKNYSSGWLLPLSGGGQRLTSRPLDLSRHCTTPRRELSLQHGCRWPNTQTLAHGTSPTYPHIHHPPYDRTGPEAPAFTPDEQSNDPRQHT